MKQYPNKIDILSSYACHHDWRCQLSIVIPLYNEAESIVALYAQLSEACDSFSFEYEVILVDDGSTDNTWELIERIADKNQHVKGIRFRRNFGQTAAMVAGFDHASGEIVVTMDGDMQNDPNDIPQLLDKLNDGYDIVSGWRKDRKDHFSRVLPSMVANWIISMSTGIHLHDYGCSLKAYRIDCIRAIKGYGDMHRFFPAFASMTGARVTELPVRHYPRQFGVSKYGFDRIGKVFNDIIATNLIIRFSSKPLIGFAKLAMPLFLLTIFFGLLNIGATLFDWTAGKALVFFIVSAQMGLQRYCC